MAAALDVSLFPVVVDEPFGAESLRHAFAALLEKGAEALVVPSGAEFNSDVVIQLIADHALESRLPAIASNEDYARAGLLMTYATDRDAINGASAGYVDRILRGENPAELPFQQPTKFDLTINLKTARELGITILPKLMIQATELIE